MRGSKVWSRHYRLIRARASVMAIMPVTTGIAKYFCSKARNIAKQISQLLISRSAQWQGFV
jgi:hypothetical protein